MGTNSHALKIAQDVQDAVEPDLVMVPRVRGDKLLITKASNHP